MSFIRTNSGLSNARLFYNADIVIYTEGGSKSYSLSEVEAGMFNGDSIDIKFWNSVLKSNNFTKKVKFKAIGSKTAGKTLTDKILNGEIFNTAIAKDRDLDDFTQNIIESPYILYTKGYSWENDVFQKDLTLAQIESMLFETEVPEEVLSLIDAAYNYFGIVGKSLVKFEILFRSQGVKFISEFSGDRFFKKNNLNIDLDEVFRVVDDKKNKITRPLTTGLTLKNICPFMCNYGKLVEALSFNTISFVCKKFSGHKSIPKSLIESAMIERFYHKLMREKDIYYSEIVNRLQAA